MRGRVAFTLTENASLCSKAKSFASVSRNGSKVGVAARHDEVCFSNRPFRVKHFQTIRRCGVDVAHGLALLFGIGTKALPPWDSRTRWSDLYRGLAVNRTAGPSGPANSPHPSSREGHHSTARWTSSFLLLDLILKSFMLLPRLVPGSNGIRCHPPICGA